MPYIQFLLLFPRWFIYSTPCSASSCYLVCSVICWVNRLVPGFLLKTCTHLSGEMPLQKFIISPALTKAWREKQRRKGGKSYRCLQNSPGPTCPPAIQSEPFRKFSIAFLNFVHVVIHRAFTSFALCQECVRTHIGKTSQVFLLQLYTWW